MTLGKLFAAGFVAIILSAGMPAKAFSQSNQVGSLTIFDPWTRATPPRAQTAGGFLTIENSGAEPDRLIGVSSSIAGRIELHEMRMDNGTMLMRPVAEGIEIPPGGRVTLAPGGLHIMFMALNESLREGDTVPVMLRFEHAGDIEVTLPVQAIGSGAPANASGHGSEMPGAHESRSHDHGHGP